MSAEPTTTGEKRRARLYLAGPEVFLPNALAMAAEKKALCAAAGFEGVFPLDNEISVAARGDPRHTGATIAAANEAMMHQADGVIANLTPYHGPSGDIGTAYEVGFMRALGKPVFAYSHVDADFATRVHAYINQDAARRLEPYSQDCAIEDFALGENLMLEHAIRETSGTWMVSVAVPSGAELIDLTGFSRCLEQAQVHFASDVI